MFKCINCTIYSMYSIVFSSTPSVRDSLPFVFDPIKRPSLACLWCVFGSLCHSQYWRSLTHCLSQPGFNKNKLNIPSLSFVLYRGRMDEIMYILTKKLIEICTWGCVFNCKIQVKKFLINRWHYTWVIGISFEQKV